MGNPKYIKQGDDNPYVKSTLNIVSGDTISHPDLTGADVYFRMKFSGADSYKVNQLLSAAEIVDATGGQVEYRWRTGDTDQIGEYLAEFHIIDTTGSKWTFWDMRSKAEIQSGKHPEPLIISIVAY